MAAATLVGAQAEAMKAAASNTSTGPMMAFAGMNMANMAGGMNAQGLFAMGGSQQAPVQNAAPQAAAQNAAPAAAAPAADTWTCSCGKTGNTGKFCAECGSPKPVAADGWVCSCGAVNKGKFCSECGAKKPAGEPDGSRKIRRILRSSVRSAEIRLMIMTCNKTVGFVVEAEVEHE